MLIIVRCWFENSEKWLNEIIGSLGIIKQRTPGGTSPVTGFFLYEEWALIGNKLDIALVKKRINDGDYDVEIEE